MVAEEVVVFADHGDAGCRDMQPALRLTFELLRTGKL